MTRDCSYYFYQPGPVLTTTAIVGCLKSLVELLAKLIAIINAYSTIFNNICK